jgi:hypothetical protein
MRPFAFLFLCFLLVIATGATNHKTLSLRRRLAGKKKDSKRSKLQRALKRINFVGSVVDPRDEIYESTRKQYNSGGYPDLTKPLSIVLAKTEGDIKKALRVARLRNVSVVVRSGGHSFAVLSSCNDCILIDMKLFKQFSYDNETKITKLGPGINVRELLAKLYSLNLAIPHGMCPHVRVGGHLQTGGQGMLSPKYGFGIDYVVKYRMIAADGSVVEASKTSHPELFWALRGGPPGNLGVITQFEVSSVPAPSRVALVRYLYPWNQALWTNAVKILQQYGARSDVSVGVSNSAAVFFVWIVGLEEQSLSKVNSEFAPLFATTAPFMLLNVTRTMTFEEAHEKLFFATTYPRYVRSRTKSGRSQTPFSAKCIEQTAELLDIGYSRGYDTAGFSMSSGPGPSKMDPTGWGTAAASRDYRYTMQWDVFWDYNEDKTKKAEILWWIRTGWLQLRDVCFEEVLYMGEPDGDFSRQDWAQHYYTSNARHVRLRAAKTRYDPTNVFRKRFSLKPFSTNNGDIEMGELAQEKECS